MEKWDRMNHQFRIREEMLEDAEDIRCGMFTLISEAGHYPWVEKPDEVKASLRQFICNQVM